MAIHKKVKGKKKHLVLPAFSFQPTDGLAQTNHRRVGRCRSPAGTGSQDALADETRRERSHEQDQKSGL